MSVLMVSARDEDAGDGRVICPRPVGDARPEQAVYCVCRRPDDGLIMVHCDRCFEWFHAACINITSTKANWVCPTCHKGPVHKDIPSPNSPKLAVVLSNPVLDSNSSPTCVHPVPSNLSMNPGINGKYLGSNAEPHSTSAVANVTLNRNSQLSSPPISKPICTKPQFHYDRTSCRDALGRVVASDLAFAIDLAVFDSVAHLGTAEVAKLYKMKMREILLNLKGNQDLSNDLASGKISLHELIKDTTSLAAPALVAARNRARVTSIRSRFVVPDEVTHQAVSTAYQPDIILHDFVHFSSRGSSAYSPVSSSSEHPNTMEKHDLAASDPETPAPATFVEQHPDRSLDRDWSGTLTVTSPEEAFALSARVVDAECESDRHRLSKMSKTLNVHGRIEPSSVHKFVMQVYALTKNVKSSDRLQHKRAALIRFDISDDRPSNRTNCTKFIQQYAERSRIPVIDNVDLGILLYFVSPVFSSNAQWAQVIRDVFHRTDPPSDADLWAIAIFTAESKLGLARKQNGGSRYHSHTDQHHIKSLKSSSNPKPIATPAVDQAKPAPSLVAAPPPTLQQLEHLELALAEVGADGFGHIQDDQHLHPAPYVYNDPIYRTYGRPPNDIDQYVVAHHDGRPPDDHDHYVVAHREVSYWPRAHHHVHPHQDWRAAGSNDHRAPIMMEQGHPGEWAHQFPPHPRSPSLRRFKDDECPRRDLVEGGVGKAKRTGRSRYRDARRTKFQGRR